MNPLDETDLREQLRRAENDAYGWRQKALLNAEAARRFNALRGLAGHLGDGSQSTVTIYQDDATGECCVKNENRKYYGSSIEAAIDSIKQ